jgi:hypothetical protein
VFAERDPEGYKDSPNPFQAFNFDAVNFTDPFGRQVWCCGRSGKCTPCREGYPFGLPEWEWELGPRPDECPPLPKGITLSEACKDALKQAKKDECAIGRALKYEVQIETAARCVGIDPSILAAIGVRESGFANVDQKNGGGRGVFQIDIGVHPEMKEPITEGVVPPHIFSVALDYAARLLAERFKFYKNRKEKFDDALSMAAAVHDYNAGTGKTLERLQRTLKRLGPKGSIERKIEEISADLDPSTANKNYVSNVLAIAKHCFQPYFLDAPYLSDLL